MAQEAENLTKERTAFEEVTKKLEHVHFGRTVKLNVGGKIYKTSLDTLQKDPDSMLAAMFSGRFDVKSCEEDGAYFIDRDGKLFRYILNFLRNGELVCPDDKAVKRQLLLEAEFYQIQAIVKRLSPPVQTLSLILNEDSHQDILLGWLPPNVATQQLLYRASRDGRRAKDFHYYCDGKGPTLVLIKYGHYIFGGYTEKSWRSSASLQYIGDPESFLFSIVNPSGEPRKLPLISRTLGGIRCQEGVALSFGNKDYYDLRVVNAGDLALQVSVDVGYNYKYPVLAYFTGKKTTRIDELEVFEVSPRIAYASGDSE